MFHPLDCSIKLADPEEEDVAEELVQLLTAEVTRSSLLEHWAHLLLLAASAVPQPDASLKAVLANGRGLLDVNCELLHTSCSDALCRLLPSSPCLLYYLASQIVSACADLDGGRATYGLPPADRLPPPSPLAGEPSERQQTLTSWLEAWEGTVYLERQRLAAVLGGTLADDAALVASRPLRALYRRELSLLEQRQRELGGAAGPADLAAHAKEVAEVRQRLELSAAAPPLNTTAGFEVSMRLAEAAKARADAATQAGAAARRRAGAWALSRVESLQLALRSLRCGRVMLAGEDALRLPSLPPALCSRLGRWWRTAVATATAAMSTPAAGQRMEGRQLRRNTSKLLFSLGVPKDPASPPGPDVAAALDAGYLPCLAAFLRAAWGPGGGTEASADATSARFQAAVWVQMLEFGETREALSLVAALADLLGEHAAALALSGSGAAGRLAALHSQRLLREAAFVLKLAGETAVLALMDHRPCRELPVAASAVVARLLPEAARLLQVLRALPRGGGDEELVDSSLALLLSVVPLPAAAAARAISAGSEDECKAAAGSMAGGSGNSGGVDGGNDADSLASGASVSTRASGGSAASGDASWRHLLLVELRLPALLGAALEQLDGARCAVGASSGGGERPERLTSLNTIVVKALAALAAWAPGELGLMVAAADRTAAAGRGHGGPLPTTALLRSVLGPGAAVPQPQVLEAVEAACGGAGPRRDPVEVPLGIWGSWWDSASALLPPSRARELLVSN
ncbi:hypothetical protein GPECTOR_61g805 [Gonium pectorale]|uniref:Uncharacterized protein n=1 Tax=Gonium pectorale TaxID=33097 RepID=A0A150G4R6_GONPE|nr:hypothetical protein GPECTOR_61g805 [Gonium pectorale]|eukprot:KXZ44852.1 hypothetical protein GPECTOR_61g805 [Gonium pectorale]